VESDTAVGFRSEPTDGDTDEDRTNCSTKAATVGDRPGIDTAREMTTEHDLRADLGV